MEIGQLFVVKLSIVRFHENRSNISQDVQSGRQT